MLRRVLLGMSRSPQIKKAVSAMPVSSGIVARFVAHAGSLNAMGCAIRFGEAL